MQIHGITHAGPVVFVANPWCFRHLPIYSILIWAAANDHDYCHDDEDGDDQEMMVLVEVQVQEEDNET